MPPSYRISRPDVLATLPRPLDHSEGQYHAGEVYTQQPGTKKRKRLEVVVGVDGEAVNIYHVPSSGLRTSYPIPPQESFTTSPYSIRYQTPNSKIRDQYTYFSTQDTKGSKITLCKDAINSVGKTEFASTSRRIQHKSPIKRLHTAHHIPTDTASAQYGDLFAVCRDGQVMCLDGASLEERWSVSSFSLCKDLLPPSASGFEVDAAFHDTAVEILGGLFGNRQDALGAFGRTIDSETFNPDVLVLVVRALDSDPESRYLVVLGAIARPESEKSTQQALVQLHVAPLPSHGAEYVPSSIRLHVKSAKLRELSNNFIRVYDLSSAVPKLSHSVGLESTPFSFVQMSEHSVLSASATSLTITNVTYRATQAQADAKPVVQEDSSTGDSDSNVELTLLTYLSKLDLVIAMGNSTLYSIQIQRRKAPGRDGLMIDAIGRGIGKAALLPGHLEPKQKPPFDELIEGTLSEPYVKQSLEEVAALDALLKEGDMGEFERLLAARFLIQIAEESASDDGENPEGQTPPLPAWKWLDKPTYPLVDRRWISYAISRVFELVDGDAGRPALQCYLPESNVLIYLVVAGHLTTANIRAAFKVELIQAPDLSRTELAEQLIQHLIDLDPTRALLLNYLTATKLSEVELLLVIRSIMRNLDERPRLPLPETNTTENEDHLSLEIELLERELERAESKLIDDSNTHARLLTTAFEKLTGYSPAATVRAMRVALSPVEILSLIHLLRIQLVGSAWTTRYSDATGLDQDDAAKRMPDGAIALIAELLSRCIDAVGTNGWLTSGSSRDLLDGGHFLTALRLEVSAALEGLNDGIALNGILAEAVRFGRASLSATNARGVARNSDRPRNLEVAGSVELPLGLTPKQAVSQFKVVSGGEVVSRSAREKGHLISQKVEEYSLERIAI